MKYTIESTNDGCIETIELSDGSKYKKKHIRTEYGSTQEDLDFCEQMEKDGLCEEILDEVYDTFDGFLASSFLRMSEFDC